MTGYEAYKIAISLVPFDKGEIMNAIRLENHANGWRLVFDVNQAEHIIYQHLGFVHYQSGKFIDKNKGFINDIVDVINDIMLNRAAGQATNLSSYVAEKERSRMQGVESRIVDRRRQQNAMRVISSSVKG